jgi:hypothetical protein
MNLAHRLCLILALVLLPNAAQASADRIVEQSARTAVAAPVYGPFRVLSSDVAALDGITDSASPAQFAQLLKENPSISVLEMHDAPGTHDDAANLALGRAIRAAGIATRVPDGGSVRSGAVELFLAGAERQIDDGAEFAVHSWADEDGLGPRDYPETAPENTKYLDYYREMGMADDVARAFYAMTNSAPFDGALWLDANDMRAWLAPPPAPAGAPAHSPAPTIAYGALPLDLGAALQ